MFRVITVGSILLMAAGLSFVHYKRFEYLGLMTDMDDVMEKAKEILDFMVLNLFIEGIRGMMRGFIKALSLQTRMLVAAIIC